MTGDLEKWQVNVNGQIFEADFQTLQDWIQDGRVHESDKVRKGKLNWLEAGTTPALKHVFEAQRPPIIYRQMAHPQPLPVAEPAPPGSLRKKSLNLSFVALLFYIFAVLGMAAGAWVFWASSSATHQVEALLLFLIGTIFLCSAAILNALLD